MKGGKESSSGGNANRMPPSDIDGYLSQVPEDERAALESLRKTINAAAPQAVEVISYKIPTFKYHGSLVAFAAQKKHLSFYVMNPDLLRDYSAEVEGYDASGGTIRFSPDRPLPASLVKKLVKARMKENEKRASRKRR
jgi:uncharacterized protein YdhG (YjbR/CyaY superfamily)